MHRHGYQGRKFNRQRDQRRALVKGLADSLIKYETIQTTLPKAKELVPYTEKLITKAKAGGLHNRRQVIAQLQTLESAHKLFDDIAPKLGGRTSGHLRIEKTISRRGDNSQLAKVSFVDDLKQAPVAKAAETVKPTANKALQKPPAKPKTSPSPAIKKSATKPSASKEKKS